MVLKDQAERQICQSRRTAAPLVVSGRETLEGKCSTKLNPKCVDDFLLP